MSAHPDIEKLPLEIDGLPIRETVREIFRNTENGTPDNISKAGCLALALKSNEVGGEGKGHVVWNAWRSNFPLMVNFAFTGFRNNVDFSSFSYPNPDENKLRFNFSNFEFGVEANFRGSYWGDDANFRGAKWGGRADFRDAVWGERADFRGARWGVLTVSKVPIHPFLVDWRSYTTFKGQKMGICLTLEVHVGGMMHSSKVLNGFTGPTSKVLSGVLRLVFRVLNGLVKPILI